MMDGKAMLLPEKVMSASTIQVTPTINDASPVSEVALPNDAVVQY
jgi:hypothetical protein